VKKSLKFKRPRLAFLSDLGLIFFLLWLIFGLFSEPEPPPKWKNPFQELPWEGFLGIEFPAKGFQVLRSASLNSPFEIQKKGQTYPVWQPKVQEALDNFLFLPEFEIFQRSESAINYGFKSEPDLILHFATRSLSIFLGDHHLVHPELFYFSFDSKNFLLLPTLLKKKFELESSDFLPLSPLKLKLRSLAFLGLDPVFKEITLSLDKTEQNPSLLRKFFKPKDFLRLGRSFRLQPRLLDSPIDLKHCTAVLWLNSEKLYQCQNLLVLPSLALAWQESKASRLWFGEPEVQLFSKQLRDYFQDEPSKAHSLRFSNGIMLKKGDPSFKFLLHKLMYLRGAVQKKPKTTDLVSQSETIPFSLELASKNGNSYLSGGLNSRQEFILEPVSGFYLRFSLKGILPSR
jgi:hypothetical protein